jgi:tetratricopeptide (TPR) repeat protein
MASLSGLGRSLSRRAAVGLLGAASLAALMGCMQTTVKTTDRRVLTPEEAAEADAKRRAERESKSASEPPRPVRPLTKEEEIVRLRGLIEKEPHNPQWHYELGLVYERDQKLELAEIRYARGAELLRGHQNLTGPDFFLGRILFKQGKGQASLAHLNRVLAVPPANDEGYYQNEHYREAFFMVGVVEYSRKNMAESERALKQFLKYGGEKDRVVTYFPSLIAE